MGINQALLQRVVNLLNVHPLGDKEHRLDVSSAKVKPLVSACRADCRAPAIASA